MMATSVFLGYDIDEKTGEIDAPCGCPHCDSGVQRGHFACSVSPEELVESEKEGGAWRSYRNGKWSWFAPDYAYCSAGLNKEFLGYGCDGEPMHLERVHNACFLIHCEGNSESPFEFEEEQDARQFANFLIMERIGEI